jgi:hypothetical protein
MDAPESIWGDADRSTPVGYLRQEAETYRRWAADARRGAEWRREDALQHDAKAATYDARAAAVEAMVQDLLDRGLT